MVWHILLHHAGREITKAAIGAGAISLLGRLFGDDSLPPNVRRSADGKLTPAPGYEWTSPAPGDFSVVWVPGKAYPELHVMAGSRPGAWSPEPGYQWVRPGDADCTAVKWTPGLLHSFEEHVVAAASEGTWRPAPGYRWVSSAPGDYRVEPQAPPSSQWQSSPPDSNPVQRIKDLATLGLDLAASQAEIEAAFRRLVKVHHPDRFAGSGSEAMEAANRAFLLLRTAYERLMATCASGGMP